MSNYKQIIKPSSAPKIYTQEKFPCDKVSSGSPQMTYLRTDEIVFLGNLTKIGTDENKAMYSI